MEDTQTKKKQGHHTLKLYCWKGFTCAHIPKVCQLYFN